MTSLGARRGLSASAVLFTCLFAAQAAILVVSPILPQVAEDFSVSTGAAAQMRSVSGITAGLAALGLAVGGDRFRLSRLLGVGLALLGAGSLASALAPTLILLMAAQAVIGLGLALVLSGALAASEAWAADGESSRVLAWALIGQPVAWVVGQPLVGLVATWHWRWGWIAVPLAASIAAGAAVAMRDASIADEGLRCDPWAFWRTDGVRRWAGGELLAFSAWAGTLIYAGAFFIETYGAGVAVTGLILGFGALAYLPGNFLGRRLLRRGPGPLLVGFALATGAGVAVFGTMRPGLVFSSLVFALLAFLAAGRTIAGAALGLSLAAGNRLAAMSLRTAMLQIGYLAGAAIGAAILPRWGFGGIGVGFGLLFAAAAIIHAPQAGAAVSRYGALVRQLRRSAR